jgi:predicted alpha/beta superfamily hydrolase
MAARSDSSEGTLRLHRRFRSRVLGNTRDLVVWLPPGCDGRRRRHPVAYFHDGQNIFDPRTAFFGNAWHASRAAAELVRAGAIEPPIMVGVYNAGEDRVHEYTPTPGAYGAAGLDGVRPRSRGRLRKYARFVAEEVVPFIDARYPTLAHAPHRALVGSSLGGLASIYGALWHPRIFGAAAALSPSVWWDEREVVRFIGGLKRKARPRLWVDIGTAEEGWQDTRVLRAALLARGWRESGGDGGEPDLRYGEIEGASHHESAWAARIGEVLRWLFPRKVGAST